MSAAIILDQGQGPTVLVVCPTCPVCGKGAIRVLKREQVEAWQSGLHVQAAFPGLDPAIRELLVSGTHAGCWKELFG